MIGDGYSLSVRSRDGAEKIYNDLTRDRERIEQLAAKINKGQVSSLHIDDIVDDFLE